MSFSDLYSITHQCREAEIEISNQCNARCIHCPTTRRLSRKHFMSVETFHKILERYNEYYREKEKPKFIFAGGGEPLTNKNLDTFIRLSSENGYPTRIITNASLLDQKRLASLVESGINEIFVSFHAIKEDEYRKVMRLDYQNSLKNVCNIRDYLKAQAAHDTKLVILANELSKVSSTAEEIKNFWKEKDIYALGQTPIWNRAGNVENFEKLVKNKQHHTHVNFELTAWCLIIKYMDKITSTGDLLKCTCDYFSTFPAYGNIAEKSLADHYKNLENILAEENKPENCHACIIGLMEYMKMNITVE